MANVWYGPCKQGLLQGDIDYETAVIVAYLIDTNDYTFSAAHQFLSSVPAAARVAGPVTLGTKTVSATGVIDSADPTFPTVTGDQSEAIILVQQSAAAGGAALAEGAQRLLVYVDTATGLPVTPSGSNITVTWNASGIAQL
jgi:hypothetical protein